jgi:hypothetical protein
MVRGAMLLLLRVYIVGAPSPEAQREACALFIK